jgi:hypothetical protein
MRGLLDDSVFPLVLSVLFVSVYIALGGFLVVRQDRKSMRPWPTVAKMRRVERDVLWEANENIDGSLIVLGPYCPAPCYVLLGTWSSTGKTTMDARGRTIGAEPNDADKTWLWCPNCNQRFTMGVNFDAPERGANVELIRELVRSMFYEDIRREQHP